MSPLSLPPIKEGRKGTFDRSQSEINDFEAPTPILKIANKNKNIATGDKAAATGNNYFLKQKANDFKRQGLSGGRDEPVILWQKRV